MRTRAEGLAIRRPVYCFFGSEYFVVDVPFAMLDEISQAEEFAALWGIGQFSGKITTHKTFLASSLETNADQVAGAIHLMVGEAAKQEFAVTGSRSFVEAEPILDSDSDLETSDECGQEFPEDQINYYENDSPEGGEWIKLCARCSLDLPTNLTSTSRSSCT